MRRYLIVVHRTDGGAVLLDRLETIAADLPGATFHVVVPVVHPRTHAWTDAEVDQDASHVLEVLLRAMRQRGLSATGEIGDANAVTAIADVLIRDGVDTYAEIILAAPPEHHEHWWDDPHRIADTFPDLPLTHLETNQALA